MNKENGVPRVNKMICSQCGADIEIMIFKGTGVCSELCRKKRDGEEDPQPRALNP